MSTCTYCRFGAKNVLTITFMSQNYEKLYLFEINLASFWVVLGFFFFYTFTVYTLFFFPLTDSVMQPCALDKK